MQVSVRYFGIVGDMVRRKTDEIELADGATVADLLAALVVENPGFAPVAKQVRAVVDGENAGRDMVLTTDSEVTLMRAIGGGSR